MCSLCRLRRGDRRRHRRFRAAHRTNDELEERFRKVDLLEVPRYDLCAVANGMRGGSRLRCAATLACIATCGTDANGDADESCRKACKAPSSSAGEQAFAVFEACAADARLHSCKECGSDGNPYTHPLLRQECEGHPPAPTGNVCAEIDGGTPPDQPCRECFFERCCEDAVICVKGTECDAVSRCVSPCPGSGVAAKGYTECFAAHPTGALPFANLISCGVVRCVDLCVHDNIPCAKCTAERCGDESAEGTSPARFVYSECTRKCANQACVTECGRVNPEGAAAEQKTLTCLLGRCTNECAF